MSAFTFDRIASPAVGVSDVKSFGLLLVVSIFLLYLVYQWALPKPIPGIPYNVEGTRNLLGDVPSLMKDISGTEKTFLDWMLSQLRKHDAPLIQLFIRPLGQPVLLLSDFREAQDILMRRRDFDRSVTMREFFEGLAPDHHILQQTNAVWKAHRRLLQDLMSPPFLHGVAGPAIHAETQNLIRLWSRKAAIAGRRPFAVIDDIYGAALDAVFAFAFGQDFAYSATRPNVELLAALGPDEVARLRGEDGGGDGDGDNEDDDDRSIVFPVAERQAPISATLVSSEALEDINGRPMPQLRWKYVTARKPEVKKALKERDEFIRRELKSAVERMDRPDADVQSAVDHMIQREKQLAEKDGRKPDYLSPVMADETFGFVIAGHDTSSTAVLWAMKMLADNPGVQTQLRAALQAAHAGAARQKRDPSIEEITGASIPYLDAVVEEILRCAGTVPAVDRQAQRDTQLLGHHVPKGTIVVCLGMGPSMLTPSFAIDEGLRSEGSRAARADGKERAAWDPLDIGAFKPERWLVPAPLGGRPGQEEAYEFDSSAGPQLAFGLGTRGCFGKRLAYLELRVFLTMIFWNFELMRCPAKLSGYMAHAAITYKPKQCYVRLRKVEFD